MQQFFQFLLANERRKPGQHTAVHPILLIGKVNHAVTGRERIIPVVVVDDMRQHGVSVEELLVAAITHVLNAHSRTPPDDEIAAIQGSGHLGPGQPTGVAAASRTMQGRQRRVDGTIHIAVTVHFVGMPGLDTAAIDIGQLTSLTSVLHTFHRLQQRRLWHLHMQQQLVRRV